LFKKFKPAENQLTESEAPLDWYSGLRTPTPSKGLESLDQSEVAELLSDDHQDGSEPDRFVYTDLSHTQSRDSEGRVSSRCSTGDAGLTRVLSIEEVLSAELERVLSHEEKTEHLRNALSAELEKQHVKERESDFDGREQETNYIYPKRLVEIVREIMSVPDSPMLLELIQEKSWSDVLTRLRTNQIEASTKVAVGSEETFPLHEACKLQPPVDVVRSLVAAYRPALRHRGQFGYVPLHFAIKCEASLAVVSALIDEYPYGARTKEDSGKLPLHLACQFGMTPELVNLLLMNHPQSIIMTDNNSRRPLDYATTDKCYRNNLSRDHEKNIVGVLDRAAWYCTVSKAATLRASDEFEAKMTLAERSHHKEMEQLQECHEKERQAKVETELGLRALIDQKNTKIEDEESKFQELKDKTDEERRVQKVVHDELWEDFERERERANGLVEDLQDCENRLADTEEAGMKKEEDFLEEIEGLNKSAQEKEDKITELKGDVEAANGNIQRRIAVEERLSETIVGLEGSHKRLEKDFQDAQSEIQSLQQVESDLNRQINNLKDGLKEAEERSVKTREEHAQEVRALNERMEEMQYLFADERDDLNSRIKDLGSQLENANDRNSSQKSSHSTKMIELEGMVAEANSMLLRREEEHVSRMQELELQMEEAKQETKSYKDVAEQEKAIAVAAKSKKEQSSDKDETGSSIADITTSNVEVLLREIQRVMSIDNNNVFEKEEEKKDETDGTFFECCATNDDKAREKVAKQSESGFPGSVSKELTDDATVTTNAGTVADDPALDISKPDKANQQAQQVTPEKGNNNIHNDLLLQCPTSPFCNMDLISTSLFSAKELVPKAVSAWNEADCAADSFEKTKGEDKGEGHQANEVSAAMADNLPNKEEGTESKQVIKDGQGNNKVEGQPENDSSALSKLWSEGNDYVKNYIQS